MLGAAPSAGPERTPPMFGRHETTDAVVHQLRSTLDARGGRFIVLVGAGGVGKSTVLRSLAESARALGYQVLRGRCLPSDVPRPFGLVQELLQATQPSERTRDAPSSGPELPVFGSPYPPGAASSEGAGDIGEADRLLRLLANPTERVDADRSTFFAQLTQFFLDLAASSPVLLAIDDVEFADDSSLDFLRRLPPLIAQARLVVIATGSPVTEPTVRSSSGLQRLEGVTGVEQHPVRPMSENELGEFVRWILQGRDPDRDSLMRWFSQTEGNPLFAEYLVRSSTGFGAPVNAELGTSDLAELLRARVAALPAAAHRVLVYASVLGKEFDFATLEAAAGQEEERVSEQIDLLVRDGLLREKGGEVYEWGSERARVDLYSQLTETRRRLLHRKVARALTDREGVTDRNLFELARQCYLGRDDLTAVDLNRRSAEVAARTFAFDTAVVQLERALECQRRLTPRDVPGEIRILIELGRFLDELGDLRRSAEVLQDAVTRARTHPGLDTELALALLGLAQTEGDLTQYGKSRELAAEAFRLLGDRGQPRGLMTAHRTLGVACWRLGELPEAVEHQRAALAIAEAAGTATEHGHALIDLANTYTLMGPARIQEAAVLYEKAASIFAETKDPAARARVLMNRALLHHYAGELEAALEVVKEAYAAAALSRSPIWMGYCGINLGQLFVELGRSAEATEAIDRAAALIEPMGDHLAIQQIQMIRGMIDECEGKLRSAQTRYRESLEMAEKLSLKAERAEVVFRLAQVAFRTGDRSQAAELLKTAQADGIETLRSDLTPRVAELRAALAAPGAPGPEP